MPNPFVHVELNTDNLKQAEKFYKTVFAWKLNAMPGMSYTMIDVGGGTGGGMQKKPMAEAPTAWLPYVAVEDVKKALAKATAAGARVVLDYMPIAEMGAIGVFIDPTGAALGVWEMAKKAPEKAPKKASAKVVKKAPPKQATKAPPKPVKKTPPKKR